MYAPGAGITAAAGTRLALQLILDEDFTFLSLLLKYSNEHLIISSCHYLGELPLGNLRACCLPWMW